jgi:hypothetical protein
MDSGFQGFHRPGYVTNGAKMMDSAETGNMPSLVVKETDLLYIPDPAQLLDDYMKIRGWAYKIDVVQDGNKFKATVDIETEDIFLQYSSGQNKALMKVVICVIYHYNSMLASLWMARHQNFVKDFIRG